MINNILECFDEKSQGERINEPLRSELQRQPSLAQAADCISRMTNIPHEALSRTAVQNFVPMLRGKKFINLE